MSADGQAARVQPDGRRHGSPSAGRRAGGAGWARRRPSVLRPYYGAGGRRQTSIDRCERMSAVVSPVPCAACRTLGTPGRAVAAVVAPPDAWPPVPPPPLVDVYPMPDARRWMAESYIGIVGLIAEIVGLVFIVGVSIVGYEMIRRWRERRRARRRV